MKTTTTKELLTDLEDQSAFMLAWAVLWRMWIIGFAIGCIAGLLGAF